MKINENTQIGNTGCLLKNLIPYVLFEDINSNTSNITLKDDVSNYKYIDIYFNRNHLGMNYVRVDTSQNMNSVSLLTSYMTSSNLIRFYSTTVSISDDQITLLYSGVVQFWDSGVIDHISDSYTYITKVVGYK